MKIIMIDNQTWYYDVAEKWENLYGGIKIFYCIYTIKLLQKSVEAKKVD